MIQNVYNAQAIIKSAFPRPVDDETAHRLMARVRCDHPSTWLLQPKEEFDVEDFVTEVRNERILGYGDRPPSPTPESSQAKLHLGPAILKAASFNYLKTPSPVRVKEEFKKINRTVFPLPTVANNMSEEPDEQDSEYDLIDFVTDQEPLPNTTGISYATLSSSSSSSKFQRPCRF